eukprot:gene27835-33616_t
MLSSLMQNVVLIIFLPLNIANLIIFLREGLGVVRLPAVDGKKLSPEELKNKTTALARFFQPKGVLGCYLSHHHFWQVVVDSKLPMAVILEDDVQLTSGFEEKLRRLVREMDDVLGQDWDVVLLGAIGRVHPEGRDTYSSRFFSTYIGGNRRLKRVSPRLYIPIRPAGTHAYMISQEGARKLLSLCAKATFHVDLDAWRHPSLRLYMSDPMLVHQTFQDTSLTELPASIVPSLPVPLPLPNLPSALSLRKLDDWTRDPITKQPWSHVLAEPLLQVTPYGPVITVQRYLIIVTALTVSSSLFSHLGWVWMGRALMGSMVGFVVAIRGIIWLLMNWR